MSRYEEALSAARRAPVTVPEFEAVANASDIERERWAGDDRDRRARARRWFLFSAALWLSFPLLFAFFHDPFRAASTVREVLPLYAWYVPMVPVLLWAAHRCRDHQLRANILTRAIATSNLVIAVLFSLLDGNAYGVFAILLAIASGRSLQLLGVRGLDGSEDHGSEFVPVRFRGVLILTLLLACTDVVTLLWLTTSVGTGVVAGYFVEGYELWQDMPLALAMTTVVIALMAVNIWGLLRLRTWALLSSMLVNVAVAVLAWSGVLMPIVGWWTAVVLTMTAVIQLLLALPIVAAALGLGRDGSRQYAWVAPGLLWVVVPAAVLVSTAAATTHLMWSLQWNIF